MAKIHGMMDIGKRSMMNSQSALQTVGHNIANKSTEGYSRQRVDFQTNEPISEGRLRIGQGAKSVGVSRTNNPYLEKQIGKEQAGMGYFQGKADGMNRVEQVFNEQVSKGLNQSMGEFFNSWREFSNNPENLASRTLVRETAESLTLNFARVHNQLSEVQKDIDQQLVVHVTDINSYTREIASLNDKIQTIEVSGTAANDERDRRDLLLKKLGEKIDIRWAEGQDGMVTISGGGPILLVAGTDAKELSTSSTPTNGDKLEGNFDIVYKPNRDATAMIVTSQIKGGAMGGLIEVRDGHIRTLQKDTDTMAFGLATAVNTAHRMGVDGFNQRGEDFFEQPQVVDGAAVGMRVAESIRKNVGKIASGAELNSPADNRISKLISNLQYKKILGQGDSTLDDYYNAVVGKVGVITRRTNSGVESQKEILQQLTNIRESISGVSLDEEATKMIEFQKAFDASARLIRTADEMFDTVLNLKR